MDSLNLITPLPSYRQLKMKVIEISDDKEQTHYESDSSISEDSVDDSIQFISKIKPNSILKNLWPPKTICRDILLEIIQKMT